MLSCCGPKLRSAQHDVIIIVNDRVPKSDLIPSLYGACTYACTVQGTTYHQEESVRR